MIAFLPLQPKTVLPVLLPVALLLGTSGAGAAKKRPKPPQVQQDPMTCR